MFLTDKLLIWACIGLGVVCLALFSWGKYNSFMWNTAKSKIDAVKAQVESIITEKDVYKRNFIKLNEAVKKHIQEGGCQIPFVIDDDDGRKPWFPWNRDENFEWSPGDDIPLCCCGTDCKCTKDDKCCCEDKCPACL